MKFHKIRGIDKGVCTAEQRIAYNYAFSDYDWVVRSNITLENYLCNVSDRIMKNDNIMRKYNIDAIIHCLRNGFIAYSKSRHHILTSYEDIGKAFYSLYPLD